jgi:hypothetical protein
MMLKERAALRCATTFSSQTGYPESWRDFTPGRASIFASWLYFYAGELPGPETVTTAPDADFYLPDVSDSVADSLASYFATFLPSDSRIETIYWSFEGSILRVWTIIDEPDFEIEQPIYEAQLRFMEKFPDVECDFSVIYRFGKRLEDIRPHGTMLVLPAT